MDNAHIHKEKIRHCFNWAADSYDQFSYPQQYIGKRLIQKVSPYFSPNQSIIDIGCGTGVVTECLANAARFKRFVAVDISDRLIEKARIRLQSYAIDILQADFDHLFFADTQFQLAFANMALQWSCDFSSTLRHVKEYLASSAVLALTLPLSETFSELPFSSRNRHPKFDYVNQALEAAGFELLLSEEDHLVMKFDSLLQAGKSIKSTGANYLFKKSQQPLSYKTLTRSGNVSLTYHIGYFIARMKSHVS